MFGIVLCDWALNYLLVIWVSKFCCDATKNMFCWRPSNDPINLKHRALERPLTENVVPAATPGGICEIGGLRSAAKYRGNLRSEETNNKELGLTCHWPDARRVSSKYVFIYILLHILSWRHCIDHLTPMLEYPLLAACVYEVISARSYRSLSNTSTTSKCFVQPCERFSNMFSVCLVRYRIWVTTAAYKHLGTLTRSTDTIQPETIAKLGGTNATFKQLEPTFLNRASRWVDQPIEQPTRRALLFNNSATYRTRIPLRKVGRPF